MPAFTEILSCLDVTHFMLENIKVKENILDDPRYAYLFSVERVNELVLGGVPFREAYRQVGKEIAEGTYQPKREVHHTHEGSIGNLANDRITNKMEAVLAGFRFDRAEDALRKLLED